MHSFYKDKTVLLTGHTGFKGSWMCEMLKQMGAHVIGFSLAPPTNPSLFDIADVSANMTSITADIRDLEELKKAFRAHKPQIAIHMAAQPVVRDSYNDPVYTYSVNVMGTVNFLEAVRGCDSVKSVINVTTDKVYKNNEWCWGYRENDLLDGFDPYSNSKSCSELVTNSYKRSFFEDSGIAISSCRAGNVIGGGDFTQDRIIPDCVRAVQSGSPIVIRNPSSTRPYQHVLEPITAYLHIAQQQFENRALQGSYNIGPLERDCVTTEKLVARFCKSWGDNLAYKIAETNDALHEANFLKLDCSQVASTFKWYPNWSIQEALEKTVELTKIYLSDGDVKACMHSQISSYLREAVGALTS